MRGGVLRLVLSLAALTLLTGCTEGAVVTRKSSAPDRTATAAPGPTASDLSGPKQAAGIPDCPASDASVAPVDRGLPDIVLPCLGGGRDVRLAGLRGRPMLISVWAQWCGPCRTEAPYLAEVSADNDTDLLVLGVDYVDPLPDKAIEFARLAGWRYPQLADPDKQLAAPLQIAGPPQTFFVAPDGAVSYRHSGPFTSAQQIRELAAEHLGVAL
jgi:cytochrome c biogenesis protein CcmG/thiol:disulfide interchange protein DsbE